MRRHAAQVLLLATAAACNSGVVPPQSARATPPIGSSAATPAEPTPPPEIVRGVPHGNQIVEVAVTENGDAALSFDVMMGMRLWPSLDGTRPPVPVTDIAPRTLSLAHGATKDELVAVILDDAGSARVLRLDRNGAVRGHASLPGQYLQAIAIDGTGALVRTADHAVEWFDADGNAKGRVVVDPGMQLRTLATRNGRSAALIADAKLGTARTIRWLTFDTKLGWGPQFDLPEPAIDGMIALSPDHHRVAYAKIDRQIGVYEFEPFPRRIADNAAIYAQEGNLGMGFIDNEHVAVALSSVDIRLWSPGALPEPQQKLANDPWAMAGTSIVGPTLAMPTENTHLIDGFAFADGMVVTGYGVALAIDTTTKTRYLGWRALAQSSISQHGNSLVMAVSGSRFVWLDDKLGIKNDVELRATPQSPWVYATPIGDHHVLSQTTLEGKYEETLVDATTKKSVSFGQYPTVDRVSYDETTGLMGLITGRELQRFKLDLETNTFTKLPPLKIARSTTEVRLYDPERAGGITAIASNWDSDYANYQTLRIYHANGKTTRIKKFDKGILGGDETGRLFLFSRGYSQYEVMEDGKIVKKLKIKGSSPTISPDGSKIVYVTGNSTSDIVMASTETGEQIWRQSITGALGGMVFLHDKVAVTAAGGLEMVDGATGIRTALECGWNFGLYDEVLDSRPMGQEPVCEDPMLQ